MPARRAVLALMGALASALAVAAVLGSPAMAKTMGPATRSQAHGAAVKAWWTSVAPAYSTLEADVAKAGTDLGHYQLTAMGFECQKIVSDARGLRSEPPVPDRSINARWQSGLRHFGEGAEYCARGVPSKTTALIRQATRDIRLGKAKLAKAVSEIRALGGAPQASTSSIRSSSQ
ncbi:MAG: hypothetical protein ACRDZR_04615 [Acidimicrobiales bacterium]